MTKIEKRTTSHMWTKEELLKFKKLWETTTIQQLADEFGVKRSQVSGLANYIRKNGYKLTRKSTHGYLMGILAEVFQKEK